MNYIDWHGCYDSNWNGLIVPDAFAHPAKYSHGLIDRIFRYMLAEGMVAKGDRIVDPFGGIGTGGIVAASLGLQWFGCELEAKFHELGLKNFDLHLMTWQACRDPIPVLVNGDSRKLRENLRGVLAQAVVCSPPYANESLKQSEDYWEKKLAKRPELAKDFAPAIGRNFNGGDAQYGTTPGQLGAMKAGDVAAVVSSPPYEPDVIRRRDPGKDGFTQGLTQGKHSFDEYGDTPGNIANLKAGAVDAVVTSPPYEGTSVSTEQGQNAGSKHHRQTGEWQTRDLKAGGKYDTNYGESEGQLGFTTGETFWHAAKAIVQECYAILRPGGWSAWVVKDFVRNKARVPFCDDWCKLLEACGFTVEIRVHAMLVKETSHPDLFGGDDHVQRTERKSFFRRLAEKKGSPRIDWEEVVFARRAA